MIITDTGCQSWHGKKYTKCPGSSQCVDDVNDCEHVRSGETSLVPCIKNDGSMGYRCRDGLCIRKTTLCNKHVDCLDGSDEIEGCFLYQSKGLYIFTY